ncbi:MAG: hypothetical protein R2712_22880 [Vicinamibacterales bacterium]
MFRVHQLRLALDRRCQVDAGGLRHPAQRLDRLGDHRRPHHRLVALHHHHHVGIVT